MKNIFISIIVPFYNTEQYAVRCIESLLAQTLDNIEIILINDASEDNVLSILKKYAEKFPNKIKLINSKKNLRQGGARNLGIKESKGDYIAFVDSDDTVAPNMYERLYLKAIEKNYDVVGGDYYLVYGNDEKFHKTSFDRTVLCLDDFNLAKYKLMAITFPGLWQRLYKRSLILDNNIFFPEKVLFEDTLFCILIVYYMRNIGYVNDAFYYYYQRENSSMTSGKSEVYIEDHYKVSVLILEESISRGIIQEFRDEIYFYVIKMVYLQTLIGVFFRFNGVKYKYLTIAGKNTRRLIGNGFFRNKYLRKNKIFYFLVLLNEYARPLLFISFIVFKPLSKFFLKFLKKMYAWKN